MTKLPFVGKDFWKSMPWCAEIIGHTSTENFLLRFLDRKVRFDLSNSKLSRGVYFHFYPETGKKYVARRIESWKSSSVFYFSVNDNLSITEISESEAHAWAAKLDWEKTCSPLV